MKVFGVKQEVEYRVSAFKVDMSVFLLDFCVCVGTLFFIYLIFLFRYVRVCFEHLYVAFVGRSIGVSNSFKVKNWGRLWDL